MQVRTIRNLDRRPGDRSEEVRTVNGIKIDTGIPCPPPRGDGLVEVLLQLQPGESFICKHSASSARHSTKVKGRLFAARRQPDGTFRIWRLS